MSDDGVLLPDLPPEAGPVRTVHIWIGVRTDGREAMLSADIGERHMPLMSSRRELAEALGPLARRLTMHRADRLIRVELRSFSRGGRRLSERRPDH